jgi:flavin-binding protein dodecin
MKYKVFVEARNIVLLDASSRSEAIEKAIAEAYHVSHEMEWNAEVIEEEE